MIHLSEPCDSIHGFLDALVRWEATEAYLEAGARPTIRVDGRLRTIGDWRFSADSLRKLLARVLDAAQLSAFDQRPDLTLSLESPDAGRFVLSARKQRGNTGFVIRRVPREVPTLAELGAPASLASLALLSRGVVMLVGEDALTKVLAAALIDHRNAHLAGHIVTIEEPIEFVHEHKECIVTQREIGADTMSFDDAVATAVRESADVVYVGSLDRRDRLLAAWSIACASSLCIGTSHGLNVNGAILRAVETFPPEYQGRMFRQLALHLRAVVAVRRVRALDGRPATVYETLEVGEATAQRLRLGLADPLSPDAAGRDRESVSFDEALHALVERAVVSTEDALDAADWPNELRARLESVATTSRAVRPHLRFKEEG